MPAKNYKSWLETAITALSQSPEPKVDAMALLAFVTQKSKAQIMAFDDSILTPKQVQTLNTLLARRLKGEPLAYILGERGFWDLDLKVSPATLIPRADTEILVEQALRLVYQKIAVGIEHLKLLDLGTGTGAIALALGYELKGKIKAEIWGVDFKQEALALAQENAKRYQLKGVHFQQSNWFSRLNGEFDFILTNPPYIAPNDPHLSQGDLRFEPLSALVAEEEGFADLFHIIDNAPKFLKNSGYLLLEHGYQQANKLREYFSLRNWQQITTVQDYAGLERVTFAQKASLKV